MQQRSMRSAESYHVIARKGEALTWQSPGTRVENTVQYDRLYHEIATWAEWPPRNDSGGRYLAAYFDTTALNDNSSDCGKTACLSAFFAVAYH